jgi:hypothetical protein
MRRKKKDQRCLGYDTGIVRFHSRFPHQLQEYEKESVKFVVSDCKLHAHICKENNFNIIGDENIEINKECEYLQTNTYLQRIIKREITAKAHTNYRYLAYDQLVEKLEEKNFLLEQSRLTNCNLKRNNITLTNYNNDISKLVSLIATNQIPRVGVMLNVLLKQGHGVNTIIDKLYEAINKVYKCKSHTKLENDVGIMVLRIGGPRVLYALNKIGLLPSKSTIYKSISSD